MTNSRYDFVTLTIVLLPGPIGKTNLMSTWNISSLNTMSSYSLISLILLSGLPNAHLGDSFISNLHTVLGHLHVQSHHNPAQNCSLRNYLVYRITSTCAQECWTSSYYAKSLQSNSYENWKTCLDPLRNGKEPGAFNSVASFPIFIV